MVFVRDERNGIRVLMREKTFIIDAFGVAIVDLRPISTSRSKTAVL